MDSPRRNPSGARSRIRRVLPGSIAACTAVCALVLGISPAAAQPPPAGPPTTQADAATRLDAVQREAEALTEQWHAATDEVAARTAELEKLNAAVGPARAAVDAARAEEEGYREQVDAVAMSTFESGRLDQFNALLASGSPEDFLEQMSALETLSVDYKDSLDHLQAVVDATSRAQADAAAATARAQAAANDAAQAEADLSARKRDAEVRIDEAERLLAQLTPQQRRTRNGPEIGAPPVSGSGVGVEAIRAAATQLGKPYQWGAEGPGSFDCSGLTSWAFRQAGVTLPRSSSQQARVGRAVSWDQMQPGDLVFYYSPVSHVGIYVGDGKMINAPQTGDVVKYATVSSRAFSGARRI